MAAELNLSRSIGSPIFIRSDGPNLGERCEPATITFAIDAVAGFASATDEGQPLRYCTANGRTLNIASCRNAYRRAT